MKTKKVSLFKAPITNVKPIETVDLSVIYYLITSDFYEKETKKLRAISDPKESGKYKRETFGFCTFSGEFTERNIKGLVRHSNLLCIDFDDLDDISNVRKWLMQDEYLKTRLLFKSPSGTGLKWIISIDLTIATHDEWFRSVSDYVLLRYGIKADASGKDVSRACFLCHDPRAFINLDTVKQKHLFQPKYWLSMKTESDVLSEKNNISSQPTDIEIIINRIEEKKKDITSPYSNWLRLGFALSNELGEAGRSFYHRLSRFHHDYAKEKTDSQYDACLKAKGKGIPITIGTFYYLARKSGVNISLSEKEIQKRNTVEFPKGMPKFLAEFSANIADVYGVPIELAAIPLISAFATAIGNKAELSTSSYTNFSQFWFAIVAPSGTGKSEPLAVAYQPILEYEKFEFDDFKEKMEAWKEAKKNDETLPKPEQVRRICNDFTPEALFTLLASNPALTLYRDELAGHFEDIGRYNKSGEIEHWLGCFNNKAILVDRKTDEEPIFISKPILSIIGTIQPKKLQDIAKGKKMQDNGYLQRYLFVYPDEVKCQKYSKKMLNPRLVKEYRDAIFFLLNSDKAETFTLSRDTEKAYEEFCNQMADLINGTKDDNLKSLYAKMKIHVLRLALTLTVVDLIENDNPEKEVPAKIIDYAIALCEYFIATGEKVHVPPPPPKQTSGDLYRMIDKNIGVKNQSKFAESLGVSPVAVSKALKVGG